MFFPLTVSVLFFQLCCCPETIKNSSPPIHTAALTSDTHTLYFVLLPQILTRAPNVF